MLKVFRLPISLASLALLTASGLADTIILKSGERIEAVIASETPTEMTLNIQVSAGITDQRVVKKSEVAKVDRVAPDELAFRALMHLQPGKSSLFPAQYEAVIKPLDAFVTQFPESTHLSDVKTALSAFQAEKKRVDEGEVKLDGLWLSKAEVQKQRIQVGGAQAFSMMKSANASGDPIGALNAFVTIEKNFPGAKIVPDATDLARQIVAALKPATDRAIQVEKLKRAEREKGFADANAQDRADMMAAHQRDMAKADAAIAAASSASLWPPFIGTSDKSLTAILGRIATEAPRLEKIPVAAMRDSIKLAEKAQTQFTAKDFTGATETLKEATKLWAPNEMAIRLAAQITEAKNPPKVDPAAAPAPGTAAANPTKPPVLPPGATPAPAQPGAPATPTPTAGTTTPAPAPSPVTAAPSAEPSTDEEKKPEEPAKPFFMTLPGAISIVIGLAVVLAGANIFSKLRQRSNETIE